MPLQVELAKDYRRVFVDPILPSATVGAVSGASGLVAGGAAGILISKHPALFAIAAGIQCFGLGTSFWYFRNVLVENATGVGERPTSTQELKYSALAGTFAGAVNGAFRSRANIIPGAVMIGLLAIAGQGGYNIMSSNQRTEHVPRPSVIQQLAESKWVPLKALSDQQYEEMLSDKLLKIEAEVSIIDERIAALKLAQESGAKAAENEVVSSLQEVAQGGKIR